MFKCDNTATTTKITPHTSIYLFIIKKQKQTKQKQTTAYALMDHNNERRFTYNGRDKTGLNTQLNLLLFTRWSKITDAQTGSKAAAWKHPNLVKVQDEWT